MNENVNNPLVSVIVPVYRVENFLPKCLYALAEQTYQNLEIILVDDGSPDHCGTICDEFAETKNNVIVIHQTNQGLSAARNNGVKESHGDFIAFIDSDDFVSKDYIEYMVSLLKEFEAEIAIGAYMPVYSEKDIDELDINPIQSECRKLLTKEEAMREACYAVKFGVSAWAKLYKRDFIEKHPYPVGVLYEELATTYKILEESDKIAYGSKAIYFYMQREGSIMHSSIGEKQLYGLTAAKEQLSYMQKYHPSVVHSAKVRVAIKIQQYMPALFASDGDKNTFNFLRSELKPFFVEAITDRYIGKALKIKIISIIFGYYPAKVTFSLIRRIRYGG